MPGMWALVEADKQRAVEEEQRKREDEERALAAKAALQAQEDERKAKKAAEERQQEFEDRRKRLMDDYFDDKISQEEHDAALAKLTQEYQGDAGAVGQSEPSTIDEDGDSLMKTIDLVDDSSDDEARKKRPRGPTIRVPPPITHKRKRGEEVTLREVTGKVRPCNSPAISLLTLTSAIAATPSSPKMPTASTAQTTRSAPGAKTGNTAATGTA
jgi:hypothetical protein